MKKPQFAAVSPPDLTGHYCPVCGKFGSFGFGPPGWLAPTRWFCIDHKSHAGPSAAAESVKVDEAAPPPKKSLAQGSLF